LPLPLTLHPYLFILASSLYPIHLHSFPTRRSSDLNDLSVFDAVDGLEDFIRCWAFHVLSAWSATRDDLHLPGLGQRQAHDGAHADDEGRVHAHFLHNAPGSHWKNRLRESLRLLSSAARTSAA